MKLMVSAGIKSTQSDSFVEKHLMDVNKSSPSGYLEEQDSIFLGLSP